MSGETRDELQGDARDGAPATDDAALKSELSPADEAIKSEPFSTVLSQAEPPAMGSAMGANGFGAPPPPLPYRYPTAAQHDAQQPYRYPDAPTGNKMAPMPPVLQAPGTVLDLGSACGAPPSCGELGSAAGTQAGAPSPTIAPHAGPAGMGPARQPSAQLVSNA